MFSPKLGNSSGKAIYFEVIEHHKGKPYCLEIHLDPQQPQHQARMSKWKRGPLSKSSLDARSYDLHQLKKVEKVKSHPTLVKLTWNPELLKGLQNSKSSSKNKEKKEKKEKKEREKQEKKNKEKEKKDKKERKIADSKSGFVFATDFDEFGKWCSLTNPTQSLSPSKALLTHWHVLLFCLFTGSSSGDQHRKSSGLKNALKGVEIGPLPVSDILHERKENSKKKKEAKENRANEEQYLFSSPEQRQRFFEALQFARNGCKKKVIYSNFSSYRCAIASMDNSSLHLQFLPSQPALTQEVSIYIGTWNMGKLHTFLYTSDDLTALQMCQEMLLPLLI